MAYVISFLVLCMFFIFILTFCLVIKLEGEAGIHDNESYRRWLEDNPEL